MANWQTILMRAKRKLMEAISKLDSEKLFSASESPAAFGIIAGLGVLGLVILNLPDSPEKPDETVALKQIESQPITEAAPTAPIPQEPSYKETSYTLKKSETLLRLLRRAGISNSNAHAAINQLKNVTDLRKLRAGQKIEISVDISDQDKIHTLKIRDTFSEVAIVEARGASYDAKRIPVETVPITQLVTGVISDSLYLSSKRAGLPDKIIVELIRMLSFDVDFEREIRVGDSFEIYYERNYAPKYDDIENTRILSAKIGLEKRTLNALYFQEENGDEGYYDLNGESTRRALMKTPLDVAVVTSSYGRRKHPVLGYTRMHKGADFRARTGTPIMAAGDGIIEMAARNGSYGNYIRIRHNGSYKTAYAHLSKYGRGIKKGRRVKQGQIIGYAGATGRVTAAHLHYEVLYNGKQVNPLTLKLPTGKTLKGKSLEEFQENQARITAEIEKTAELQLILASKENETTDADR